VTARWCSAWEPTLPRIDLSLFRGAAAGFRGAAQGFRGAAHGFRGAAGGALDLLLPPQCASCEARVGRIGQFCAACFAKFEFVTDPMCRRCGVPFASARQGGTDGLCVACLADPPLFGHARAALRYDANARRLILPFKHADRLELVEVLAPMMARAGAGLLRQAELLIPVPLHRRRLFARRYNQAALLAGALGRVAGRPVLLDGMVRHRATVSLGDKTARERAAEVADAFAVQDRHAGTVAGRRILLIDDVMTSGATANACARALFRSGAAGVDVLVAARVPDPRGG